jgi:hypothetical protein
MQLKLSVTDRLISSLRYACTVSAYDPPTAPRGRVIDAHILHATISSDEAKKERKKERKLNGGKATYHYSSSGGGGGG